MERLVIFNDYANIEAAFRQLGIELDEQDLLSYLSEGRFLVEAHAFVPVDPRNAHARDALLERLWKAGYVVHDKLGTIVGDGFRCNLDVEITMELMRTAEMVKPDIIVLMSGDKDFIPVILELRRRGIRVEVAAFPHHNAAREVMLKASGFIDLERYHEERWAKEEESEAPLLADVAFEGDAEDPLVAQANAPSTANGSAGVLARHERGRWFAE
jgi:uncharacterized LabA/DUF88 family protein